MSALRWPSSCRSSLVVALACVLSLRQGALAQPVPLSYASCAPSTVTEPDPSKRVNITSVVGQIVALDEPRDRHLKLTAFGAIGNQLEGYSNETSYLATLFTRTNYLTYSIFYNTSALCDVLRPPSPLPPLAPNDTTDYCPLPAGELAFGLSIPLPKSSYALKTLVTQIRIVDSSSPAHELTCLEVAATPSYQSHESAPLGGLYGPWQAIFWVTIGLTLAYWLVTGLGRVSAAWDRGLGRSRNRLWRRTQRTGFVIASALSGEKFSVSPALLRFVTPSARDLILTTQWCATIGMIAVEWPDFAYPIFSTAAWSTLLSNTTLISGNAELKAWSPIYSTLYSAPSNFEDQISTSDSPLYLDSSLPNVLITFPPNSRHGMDRFISAVGVLPQNAFGICMSIFLLIVTAVVAVSTLIAIIGWLGSSTFGAGKKLTAERKDIIEVEGRRTPWKQRFSLNSFHGSVTHGNLVRLLILFHLPITVYCCYHLTLSPSIATIKSKVLAGFSLVIFSLLLPGWLVFRVATTPTAKLYEATRTLLALGPLYNQYQPKSQLFCCFFFGSNIVMGMVVGFGQASGTVQAVIILILEVLVTLSTSVWLPWMAGAQMGVISFMFCVARIIATVLVVILAPPVKIGSATGGWIALGIISVMGLMYVGYALMLLIKVLEGIIRLVRGVPFASSRHTLDSGLLGALGCCGGSETAHRRRRRHRHRGRRHSRAYSESTGVSHPPYAASREAGVSYLKPEHASIPYRESSDDDTGFIMESWSKTDLGLAGAGAARSKGKLALEDTTMSDESEPSQKTGFARVGGGRAHIDTPYSILKGKQPQNSLNALRTSPPPSTQFSQPPPNTLKPPSKTLDPLPRGAARPFHPRTRSQTAVIEDASTLMNSGGLPVASGGSASRPGSSGNPGPSASRPGSSGRGANGHGRPGSSGKPGNRSLSSRPPSSGGIRRSPSRDVPSLQGFAVVDEMGAIASNVGGQKPASSRKDRVRKLFGLGGSSANESSSDDEEDEEKSRESSVRRGGWPFKRRRKSDSDMSPLSAASPTVENRSFVVIRNRPPHQGPVPIPNRGLRTGDAQAQWSGVDQAGSPLPESHLPTQSNALLVAQNPSLLSPEYETDPSIRGMSPPPSSYVPPKSSRMSSRSAS